MSRVRPLLSPLAASLALSMAGPEEQVTFGPAAGSTLVKAFEIEGKFGLDELGVILNGQDVQGMLGEVSIDVHQVTRIAVTDVYKAVADGRPTELLRTYDEITSSMDMSVHPAEGETQFEGASELEGLTVSFRWDDEKQAYERTFPEEGAAEEELLQGLEEDMDLRVFLPAGEVAEGATWSVELADLASIAMPGGDLRMRPEGTPVDEAMIQRFEELFADLGADFAELLDGDCKCTYRGAREVDGARLAEVGIEIEIATTLDLVEILEKAIQAAIQQMNIPEAEFSLGRADLNMDFEGSGTLLWDLEHARLRSFQLDGDATIGLDFSISVEVEDDSQSVDVSLEFSGEVSQEVTTEGS